jgi:hypothetical protein
VTTWQQWRQERGDTIRIDWNRYRGIDAWMGQYRARRRRYWAPVWRAWLDA